MFAELFLFSQVSGETWSAQLLCDDPIWVTQSRFAATFHAGDFGLVVALENSMSTNMPHLVDTLGEMDKDLRSSLYGATTKSKDLLESDIKILQGGYIERRQHMKALNDLDLLASTILALVFSGTESLFPSLQDAINQSTVACAIDLDGKLVIASNAVSWQPKKRLPKYELKHVDQEKFDVTQSELEGKALAAKKVEIEKTGKTLPQKIGLPKGQLQQIKEQALQSTPLHHHYAPFNLDPRTLPLDAVLYDPKTELSTVIRDISRGLVSKFEVLNMGVAEQHAEMQLLDYFLTAGRRPDHNVIGVSKPCCRFCAFWLLSFGVQISTYHTVTPFGWDAPDHVKQWSKGISGLGDLWSTKMSSKQAMAEYGKTLLDSVPSGETKRVNEITDKWRKLFV